MFKTLACNSIKFASRKTPCCSFATSYKVGTPIPVNIMKDGKDPVILEDSEYPDWVFNLVNPLPMKAQLLEKYEKNNGDVDILTVSEARRLKKLVTLEDIKERNSLSSS